MPISKFELGSTKQDGSYILEKDEKLWMLARLKGNQKLVAYLKALVNEDQKKIAIMTTSGGAVVTANPLHRSKSEIRQHGEAEAKRQDTATVPRPEEEWTPITDEVTGKIYWWNKKTDKTTSLGAPKPVTEEEDTRNASRGAAADRNNLDDSDDEF